MKRKSLRILVILALAVFALVFSAACDNDSAPEGMPEFVYLPDFITMPDDISRVTGIASTQNAVFFATEFWDVETNRQTSSIYTLNFETDEIVLLPNYTPMTPIADAEGFITLSLGVDAAGNLWVSESGSFWTFDIPEDFDGEEWEQWDFYVDLGSASSIRMLDDTGNEILALNLDSLSQGTNWFQISSFNFDDDNNIYILAMGDSPLFGENQSAVFVLDENANMLFSVSARGWGQMVRLNDGTIAIMDDDVDAEGMWRQVLRPIDVASQDFGDSISLPRGANQIFQGSTDFDFMFNTTSSLYGVTLSDSDDEDEPQLLLNWLDSGVLTAGLNTIAVLSDGRILTASDIWDRNDVSIEVALLTRTPSADLPERSTITLAALWLDSNLQSAIVNFNRNSLTHRIVATDYNQFNTEDNWDAGLTQLSAEIIAGNVPDILDISSLPFRQYASRGILHDLYSFIDADPELSRDSFVDGVLQAAEMDGRLFQIFHSFSINTMSGHPSVLGSEPGWTMEEFFAVLAANPQADLPIGQWNTRDNFISSAVMNNLDQYVDWIAGTVNFDSQDFITLLEQANQFPATFDDIDGDFNFGIGRDPFSLIAQGRQIIRADGIWDFSSVEALIAQFGGEVVFKGFPTETRNGTTLQPSGGLAITSTASDPDGAWEFIRTLLLEDFQRNNIWNFPVSAAVFDSNAADAMARDSMHTWGWGEGSEITLLPLSAAQLEQTRELIRSAAGIPGWDMALMNIISEGADDFFSGRSSAADAARVIQSRATILISEQG